MAKFGRGHLPPYLRDEQERVEKFARDLGLDFFPTVFEVVGYEQMNELASYGGFPTRYPHWRFGMEYERLSKSYEYGLSKIYEMVINNNPAVAYLLEGNSLVDQKLVMSHVYAHVDFFKNSFAFAVSDQGRDSATGEVIRKWVDTMANHGALVRKWSDRVGGDTVEEFLDMCLRLENLIDPQLPFVPRRPQARAVSDEEPVERAEEPSLLPVQRDYMAAFINPDDFVEAQKRKAEEEKAQAKKFPAQPVRDVMAFLMEHAPLERWERDLLNVVRQEAYYFLPQMQTKIMNEGWASYWHSKLMTEYVADSSEIVDYSDRNAGVLAVSPGQLNPYKLGVELYRDIEERWNKGQFGKEWDDCQELEARQHWDKRLGLGRKKIFQVRSCYTDVTFIDEFVTPEFAAKHKLFSFGFNAKRDRWEVVSRQFEEVKQKLLFSLTNAGQPFIYVQDANHQNRGELLLWHDHQGIDLRVDYVREVLFAMERIWRRPIELHSFVGTTKTSFRYDGREHYQRSL